MESKTLKECLAEMDQNEQDGMPADPELAKMIKAMKEERDDPVYNLEKELYQRVGLKEDDVIQFPSFDNYVLTNGEKIPDTGWAMIQNLDDFSIAIYKDGQPMGAMYMSCRGSMYQAGMYLAETDQHFYAHNMAGICGRGTDEDTWVEEENGLGICSGIARDILLNRGEPQPEPVEVEVDADEGESDD